MGKKRLPFASLSTVHKEAVNRLDLRNLLKKPVNMKFRGMENMNLEYKYLSAETIIISDVGMNLSLSPGVW